MADIRKIIGEVVSEALPKNDTPKTDTTKPATTTDSRSVADTVRAEIEKIKAHEKQSERDATIDQRLAELAETIKEKPPVERRRVHRLMGWGD